MHSYRPYIFNSDAALIQMSFEPPPVSPPRTLSINEATNEHTNQNEPCRESFQSLELLEICPLIPFCMIKMSSSRLEGTAASFSFSYALLINSRLLVTQWARCCPCESQHRKRSRRVEQRSIKPRVTAIIQYSNPSSPEMEKHMYPPHK